MLYTFTKYGQINLVHMQQTFLDFLLQTSLMNKYTVISGAEYPTP
jgi:hypothetical protein